MNHDLWNYRFDRIEQKLDVVKEELDEVREEVTKLKVKASLWGIGAGGAAAVLAILAKVLV